MGVLRYGDQKLRVQWHAPDQCDMDPVCPYCFVGGCRTPTPALSATHEEWLEAWEWFGGKFGPLWINVALGEPMSCAAVVDIAAKLSWSHHVGLNTNCLAPMSQWRMLAVEGNLENLGLSTSFHPHVWASVEGFAERLGDIREAGFAIECVGIVAWPPYLKDIPQWLAYLTDAGYLAHALPFSGRHGGHAYPEAYEVEGLHEPATLQVIREHLQSSFGSGQTIMRSRGRRCAAGRDYALVRWDGTVTRCGAVRDSLGNILDKDVQLNTDALVCPVPNCSCPDLWQYIEA